MPLILIDHGNALTRPAQVHGALNQIVLAGFAGGVVAHLNESGLANVDEGLPVEVIRPDFGIVERVEHGQTPWQTSWTDLRPD